ncbi:MAG: DUF4115 domain-containing protein [Candidatus Omnitrophica bacterium]|nr:DUF4115 domain-containing protein [Candidatus Omnitrophota bacterium]
MVESNLEDKKQEVRHLNESPSKKGKKNQGSKEMPKGALLKSIREKRNLSLELVHEETKIPIDALRAIEEGYTVRTLSPFYYKGFLKIYAQYLNLDVTDFVEDYSPEKLPKTIHVSPEDQSVSLEKVQETLNKVLSKQRKQQIVILVGIVFVLVALFKIITFFTSRPSKPKSAVPTVEIKKVKIQSTPVTSQQVPAEEPERVVQPAVVPSANVVRTNPPSSLTAQPNTTQGVQKNVILTVRAKKSSWMRVKSDDKVVFQSTLDTGSVETWMADDAIEISGKNINQLEFELNGKMIGSLGRADRKANKIVVTKDGLTVSK